MEGGPQNNLRVEKRPDEIVEDYLMYVGVLNTSDAEKELLRSLITSKMAGKLIIAIAGGESREVDINPTKPNDVLIEEICEALDYIDLLTFNAARQRILEQPPEKFTVIFNGIIPSDAPTTLQQ
jgi:hypothetical protein